jgi:hypothetical protein
MTLRDAMILVRTQAHVPRVGAHEDRDALIVAGPTATIDLCQKLLEERNAVLRVAEPHAPLDLGRYEPDTLVPHVFRIREDHLQDAVTLLRALYSIRILSDYPPDSTIALEAPQPVLDAIEDILRELQLLAPSQPSDGER